MREKETSPGEGREDGLAHARHALRRNDGIERIAAVLENLGSGRSRDGMSAYTPKPLSGSLRAETFRATRAMRTRRT